MSEPLTLENLQGRAVVTISEAAQILGVGRVVIRQALKDGSLPALYLGSSRKCRVSVPALVAVLERGTTS